MTWTCWDVFTIFHYKLRASCSRPQCAQPPIADTCSSRSSIPITQSPPSPLSKQPPSSRLRVLFFVSGEMSIDLSIDLSVHFLHGLLAAAAAAGFVYYSAVIRLAAASNRTSTGWRSWRARPPNALASGRPPRAPSPPSPISSPSFSVRLIDCVHFLVYASMLHHLLPAWY